MAIRVYKPTSPARRFMSVLTYEEITKKTPEKSLTEVLKKNSGRNKQGKNKLFFFILASYSIVS